MDKNSEKIFVEIVRYSVPTHNRATCLIWPIGHSHPANNPQPAAGFLMFGNVKRKATKTRFKSNDFKICRKMTKSRLSQSKMIVNNDRVASLTQKHRFATY